ncbi:probable receptor protein kinase tmk1 [Phtheirospermum japonicum]|uniref:Probable receptor protein kinase tmk1 n=1 Tax=Phtheirospermum japonicum TaxID=374723 RepID=A0A830C8U1_9LAMI|nr:probable receptor protein kinase tmk1 [Phtheirospermum japonicum]
MLYIILGLFFISLLGCVNCITDPNDFKILIDFKNNLKNPELLKWPDNVKDPCGPPSLPHLFCSNGKVTQIQVQGLGLEGPLPQNFNQLDKLQNLGLQKNKFNGKLPSFSGLSDLEFVFLDFNAFDTIPSDFFHGLSSVRVLALDENPFNQSFGWAFPSDLADCTQLVNLSCSGCNINGPLPDYLGNLPSLASLRLSYNRLSGNIPSTFRGSMLQILWLNDQDKVGMTGPINIIGSMLGLTSLWLHGNHFIGSIPDDIGLLTSLKELNLNGNRLVGLIPPGLANLDLQALDLNNNMLMGPIPKFKAVHATYQPNSFCASVAGEKCAPEVSALLDFLHDLNYPDTLASGWSGNHPCDGPWWGISCNPRKEVTVVNLQRLGLNGTLSPSLANLPSLHEIHLEGNNLHGSLPINLTHLALLRVLNLNGNNLDPPLPTFRADVKVVTDGNPKFQSNGSESTSPSPHESPDSPRNYPSPSENHRPESPNSSMNSTRAIDGPGPKNSRVLFVAAAATGSTVFVLLGVVFAVFCVRRRKMTKSPPARVASHPNKDGMFIDSLRASNAESLASYGFDKSQSIESGNGNLLVSLHLLRKVTGGFAKENELGRGGFGVVYRGELDDGSEIAVKRMVVGAVCNTALDEFRSEIGVLSSVRHRNLVSLLGYSVEGDERLLVYEYMPRGALSRHLFRWESLGLEPLTWTRRINIALDVARGVEYLHKLAHHSFVHRDLKSANILLDDGFRAKVADFGLVKLAPDREVSVATRLAGTFGYLAPEYAVTGKITTKVDVFSFGVVLMELLTGLSALDEQRPEEKRYLAEWFWRIKSNKESLIASIDPALDAKEDIYDTIYAIATLAGHCTARDPTHRPEMGHAVNVLGQLVEKWRPYEETDEYLSGINMTLPLPQMLKGWQEEEGETRDFSYASQDSKGSIPAKPSGFADSFTSNDAR